MENTEVGAVTKKVLVSFAGQIAIPFNGSVIMTHVAICETPLKNERYELQLQIIGLPDKKLVKSFPLSIISSMIISMVEIEDGDLPLY